MRYSGVCGWWQKSRKGGTSGQVATVFTLAIAIIFLFVAITLNISKVAQKKTMTANAADGAAMMLSSFLGSLGNYLSQQYLDGGEHTGWKKSMGGFFAILGTIVAIVAAVFSGGSSLLLWAGILGALAGAGSYYYQQAVLPGKISDSYNKEFAKMTPKDSFMEQSIFYALMLCVDDPNAVIDTHDIDQDGDSADKISRFSEWYYGRLQGLTGGGGQFVETRKEEVVRQFMIDVEEFAVRNNEFRRDFSEDGTRPLVEEGPAAGVDGAFIILLEELEEVFQQENQPFPITFWRRDADIEDVNYDEVDMLSQNIFSFFLFALDNTEQVPGVKEGFCYQDVQTLVNTMDIWINYFYPTGTAGEEDMDFGTLDAESDLTWYQVWQEQINKMTSWQSQLQLVDAQLDVMIAEKQAQMVAAEQAGDVQAMMQLASDIGYLYELKDRIRQAVINMTDCQQRMANFNTELENMYAFWLQGRDENFAQRHQAVYSWQDSLGWHHIRVEVSDFAIPGIKHQKRRKWYGHKERLRLVNGSGTVWVEVTRYDQSTATSFARRGVPLWNFRYTQNAQTAISPGNPQQALAAGIKSKATARYDYRNLPRIVGVDK
ncbi:MAG: hypothetical protein V1662_02910 [Candidatus Omnitrophota bacterium]